MAGVKTVDVPARGRAVSPQAMAANLTVRERVLLFCVASQTDWQKMDIPPETISAAVVKGLVMRDPLGRLEATDRGRAALRTLLPE